MSRGTVLRLFPVDDPSNGARFYGHELLPIGERLYEVGDEALDGTWIELVRSLLPPATVGRPTLDFDLVDSAGNHIRNTGYRGRYLLLDFWPSWCGPCVKEFENIKAMVANYSGRPLAVVSINLDSEKGLESARKVIADKQLTWPQVLPGKGYFLPLYQVFGRLPENPGAFPLYVLIGPDGVVEYATNAFSRVKRFVEVRLAEQPHVESIFVPMVGGDMFPATPHPVDFTNASTLRTQLSLPANLREGSRIGRLRNGMVVVAGAASTPDKLPLLLGNAGDSDLTDDTQREIPVLDTVPPTWKGCTAFNPVLTTAAGAQWFLPFYFFALRRVDGPPEVYYWGYRRPAAGSFVAGGVEYRLEITDSTGDLHYSDDDVTASGFLTLKQKKAGSWVTVFTGADRIPIAGKLFRVRRVDDDGLLVELIVQ
jgi:peroxiredoxin